MLLKIKRKYYFIINIFLLILLILVLNGNNVYSETSGKKIYVDKIVYSGNSIYDDQTLNEIIKSNLEQEHTLNDLKELTKHIQEYYRKQGYFLAQVIVPQQEIEDETVKFLVFEGELGEIIIEGNENYGEKYIRRALSRLEKGTPIKKEVLERGLLTLNNTSGIKVNSVLKAGSERGVTDIHLNVKEYNQKDFSLINEFNFETQDYDISSQIDIPNISGRGDNLVLDISKSDKDSDVRSGMISYNSPLKAMDKQLSMYYKANKFDGNKNFSSLDIEGSGNTWGIGYSHSALLTPSKSLQYNVWLKGGKTEQMMLGETTRLDKTSKINLGLDYKNSKNKDQTLISTNIHRGLGDALGGMEDDSSLSSRPHAYADNEFTKIDINFNNINFVDQDVFFKTRLVGQYAFDSLVSGEQWSIGGLNSVRGYPESIYSGDDGFTFNLELYKTFELFSKDSQLFFFYDHGQIKINKPHIDQDEKKKIYSGGIGLNTNINENFNLSLDWGFPSEKDYEDTLYFKLVYNYKI